MSPRFIKIASDITAALTAFSLIPYEMGQVADIFPPEVKKWGVLIGASATVILRIVSRVWPGAVTPPHPPVLQPASNVIK